jgi:hypothetical protein
LVGVLLYTVERRMRSKVPDFDYKNGRENLPAGRQVLPSQPKAYN